jgi:hypothetical protein
VLDEGPAGADEDDGEEEQRALQQMRDVVKHGPEEKVRFRDPGGSFLNEF